MSGDQIRGTATISLKTLDELRQRAAEAEKAKKRCEIFAKRLMDCYEFDAGEYHKALKEIDEDRNLTDRQCMKKVSEAMTEHLKIVINTQELKELIQEFIDEDASDEHMDLAKAKTKELEKIRVVLDV